ncbi:hypothetical protein V8G54_002946 [Vigna mungo]|uniref:SUF system FeS cluster assembly SufBD core domain-containing protein n=1 Tax=Vigna mungo TaxID=3915 RepID=A0AAQ3PB77_VIGMU
MKEKKEEKRSLWTAQASNSNAERPNSRWSYWSYPSDTMYLSNPRVLVVLEKGARAHITEDFFSEQGNDNDRYWSNAAFDAVIGEGVKLSHSYVHFHAAHTKWTSVRQDSSSAYELTEVRTGGKLGRHNLRIQQLGPDTVTELSSLHLSVGEQMQDLHSTLVLDHPRGYSRQLHKCIVAHSQGHAVFDGNIKVECLLNKDKVTVECVAEVDGGHEECVVGGRTEGVVGGEDEGGEGGSCHGVKLQEFSKKTVVIFLERDSKGGVFRAYYLINICTKKAWQPVKSAVIGLATCEAWQPVKPAVIGLTSYEECWLHVEDCSTWVQIAEEGILAAILLRNSHSASLDTVWRRSFNCLRDATSGERVVRRAPYISRSCRRRYNGGGDRHWRRRKGSIWIFKKIIAIKKSFNLKFPGLLIDEELSLAMGGKKKGRSDVLGSPVAAAIGHWRQQR